MEVVKKKITGYEDHYVLYMFDAEERVYSAYMGKGTEDLLILLDKSKDDRFQMMDEFVRYIDEQLADGSLVSTYDKLAESVVKCTNDKLAEFNRDMKQLGQEYTEAKTKQEPAKVKNDLSDAMDIKGIEEIDMQSPLGRHIIEALRERLNALPGAAPAPMGGMIPHGRAFQMKAKVDKDGKISFGPDDINNMMMDLLSNIIVAEVKSGRTLSEAINDIDTIVNAVSVNAAKLTLRFRS